MSNHPNPSVAMAWTILDELQRHGVRHMVIAPGSRSAALSMTALTFGFDVHVEVDERSAGFLALGLGRSGIPAAVIVTSGTAVANLVPAVVEADMSEIPMLVLASDRPKELRDRGANQSIEQVGIFSGRVRWEFDPGPAQDLPESNDMWRSMVATAVGHALGSSARPGPVHLNLPFREPTVPASDDGRTSAPPFENSTVGKLAGDPWVTNSYPGRTKLSTSTQPERALVLIGEDPSQAVVPLDGVAYAAEPHTGHRGVGALTGLGFVAGHPVAERLIPDRVVRVGRVGLSRPIETWLSDTPSVMIDPTSRWVTAAGSDSAVVATAAIPVADREWLAELRRVDTAVRNAIDDALDEMDRLTEPRIVRDTADAVPDGGRLVSASSMPIRDLDSFMRRSNLEVVANRGVSGIDGFVSTALGVAALDDSPTVALTGDLSMLHDLNGLLLSPRPDCVFVIVDNDGGGIFSFLPQANFPDSFERVFGTPHGRSFEAAAGLHGVGYREATHPEGLKVAIEEAIAESGVSFVVARTDRSENLAVHRHLTEVAHTAIDLCSF